MSDLSEVEKKEKQRAYEKLPHRLMKSRIYSAEKSHKKKIVTTSRRFEEHTIDDLLLMAAMKCQELGLDYEKNESTFRFVFDIMHATPNDHKNAGTE